nr:anoctamin-4-like isoform X1 [Procambarus clarkii]
MGEDPRVKDPYMPLAVDLGLRVVMSTSGGDSEYSTPLQSHRASRHLASPTSYTSCDTRDILRSLRRLTSATASIESVYYSTTELHDPGDLSDMDAELIADHNDILMDDLNGQPPNKANKTKKNPDLFMEDGVSSIDFILVSRDSDVADDQIHIEHEERREVFEKNLEKEGLILEVARVEDVPLRFVKLHAPFEVCTRYAEILKLRMPMKEVRHTLLHLDLMI